MRYFKWVVWGFVAIVLMMVLFLTLLINSNYGRERILKTGIAYANDYLNATIEAEQLSGNIFTHIHLSNVSMQLDSTRVAHIKDIDIFYSPLKLLDKLVAVDSVKVCGVSVLAFTMPDSSWCFEHLHRPMVSDTTLLDTTATNFKVDIKNIRFSEVDIISKTPFSYIPKSIEQMSLAGAFYWDAKLWRVTLKQLNLQARQPNLHILDLNFDLASEKETLSLTNFNLRTDNNQIQSKGIYTDILNYSARLIGKDVDLSEMQFALPAIKLKNKPSIWFDANTDQGVTECKATLKMEDQLLDVALSFSQMSDTLFALQNVNVNVVLKGVFPYDWGVPMDSTSKISASISAQTNRLKSLQDSVLFQIQIDTANYTHYQFYNSSISGLLVNKRVKVDADLNSSMGRFVVEGELNAIGSQNGFWANGNFTDLKPQNFTLPQLPFTAHLNGNFEGSGSVASIKALSVSAKLNLAASLVDKVAIDSASLGIAIYSDTIKCDNIEIYTPEMTLKGDGNTSFDGCWNLTAQFNGAMTHLLKQYSAELPLEGNLELQATCSGVRDSLVGVVNGEISQLKYDSITVAHTSFGGKLRYNAKGGLSGEAIKLSALAFLKDDFKADSLQLQGHFDKTNLYASIQVVQSQKLKAVVEGRLNIDDGYTLAIERLEVVTPYASFYNSLPKVDVSLKNRKMLVSGISLKDKLHPDFALLAHGALSTVGKEEFDLSIEGFDLNILSQAKLTGTQTVGGILNSNLSISGTSIYPAVNFTLNVDSLRNSKISTRRLTSQLMFNHKAATLDLLLLTHFNDSLVLKAQAPLSLSSDSSGLLFHFPGTLKGRLKSTDMNLAEREYAQKALTKMGGLLSFDVGFSGMYSNLIYKGGALLKNGFYHDIKNGVYLNNINSGIAVDSNLVTIDSLTIDDDKSKLAVSGFVDFDTSVVTGRIKDVNVHLKANNFNVVKSKERELIVAANLNLKMDDQHPMVTGDINVLKSSFYYPAFLETDYKAASQKPSLLVVARDKQRFTRGDSLKLADVKNENKPSYLQLFTNDLGALVHIDIPKNSWLKSETSKIELKGDINVVKKGPNISLQGKIEVTRGQLTVYGRKFTITMGTMEFQGGEKINPLLDITTEYEFRASDGTRKVLKMRITNFLEQPEINYTLDGQVITASNAYSYIVFGKPMNEIGSGEQMDITGAYAADAVSKIVSNQLSQTVGETFSLDIIEINTSENLQSMAFTVGKYITKDIFITYQKGFGETSSTDYLPDQFTLEYEFVKNLVFRVQSGNSDKNGVDLILKFER